MGTLIADEVDLTTERLQRLGKVIRDGFLYRFDGQRWVLLRMTRPQDYGVYPIIRRMS